MKDDVTLHELMHERTYLLRTAGVFLGACATLGAIVGGVVSFAWDEWHDRLCPCAADYQPKTRRYRDSDTGLPMEDAA